MLEVSTWTGGAHPGHIKRLRAVNLDDCDRDVQLTSVFPEHVVLSALLTDKLIMRALLGVQANTAGDVARLANGGCEVDFTELENSFAFHAYRDGKVAIRIGLPHGCETMRGRYTEIGISVDVQSALRAALERAAASKQLGSQRLR